jgi:divalent metal cation (Fe/Co/Zn/Cd) transporter
MTVECGVSIWAAVASGSAVLLAFGADSLVELLSAVVVLLSLNESRGLSKERAARISGILLFVLAAVVALVAVLALVREVPPETSVAGIAIALAALVAMPVLAWRKRKLAGETNSLALAADAMQSATCAWLALATLAGLALNAAFHLRWVDSAIAIAVLPLLMIEGRRAMRGEECGCGC